jgi:hypothetical protein
MRHGTSHKLDVRCARELDIIRESRLAGYLGTTIDAAKRLADDLELAFGSVGQLIV